ncbi:MAG: hypothetical protein AAFN08_13450 [Cyanobacteria bacterium J06559_3]
MKQAPRNFAPGSLIKWLHPMFWVAAGLHGFLLFVPLSSEETIAVPEEEATETITVSRIPSSSASNASAGSNSGQSAGSQSSAAGGQSNGGGAAASSGTSSSRSSTSSGRSSASGSGASGEDNANRDVEDEIADLSDDSSANGNSDASDTVAVRGNIGSGENNGVDPLLAYAREISDREPQVSESLYNYVRVLSLAYTPYNPVDGSSADNDETLTDIEESDTEEKWLSAIRAKTNRPNLLPEQVETPVTIDYPLIRCLNPSPNLAEVGVLVDANGEIIPVEVDAEAATMATVIATLIGEPLPDTATVIEGTGYHGLDREAIKAVSGQTFEAKNEVKAYLFEVQVDYDPDDCFALPN